MSCQGCAGDKGTPNGCKSNGGCSSGGCNRLNTFDWLSKMDIYDPTAFEYVEVSFKNGSRKEFYRNEGHTRTITGDTVVVEAQNGYDIGKITLSGELVRLQMKKKRKDIKGISHGIIRRANERDVERLKEARDAERRIMVRARVIARTLDLDMKIGDVEFQGDKRKATFYYVADGRVDFRELIRHFAKEFRVKIEMRQIGARQESARIGGIGSCGRELCCSTWLTDFKSVSTTAARYQNLAINQSKLSGQCGRLKCCLNYELDTYMDALQDFPKGVDTLMTEAGKAILVKTDIFKRIMYFAYAKEGFRGQFYPLDVNKVKEIAEMNKAGEKPLDLQTLRIYEAVSPEEEVDFDANLTGVIELPMEKRKRKRRKPRTTKDKNTARSGGNRSSENKGGKPKSDSKSSSRRDNKTGGNKGRKPETSKTQAKTDKQKSGTSREDRRGRTSEANAAKAGKANTNRNQNRSKNEAHSKTNEQAKPATNKPTRDAKPPQNQKAAKDKQARTNAKSRRSNKAKNRPLDNKTSKTPTNQNKPTGKTTNDKTVNNKQQDKPTEKSGDSKSNSRRNRNRNRNRKNKGGDSPNNDKN